MKKLILTLSAILLLSDLFATTYHVKTNQTGSGTGMSWANASHLSNALNWASTGDTIWMCTGSYISATMYNPVIKISGKSLAIYGGFNGTETSVSQADWITNPTTLNGDRDGDDNTNMQLNEATRSDNSYSVVSYTGDTMLNGILYLEGFIIKSANNTQTGYLGVGGGICAFTNYSSQPILYRTTVTVKNCKFENNIAAAGGAIGLTNQLPLTQASVYVDKCTFIENYGRGSYGGGAVSALSSNIYQQAPVTLSIVNSNFIKNSSNQSGGAIGIGTSSSGGKAVSFITNNTFYDNVAASAPATFDCTNFADSTYVSGFGWIVGGVDFTFRNNIVYRPSTSIVNYEIRSQNFGDGYFNSNISDNILDLTNSLYQGTTANNLAVDPLFVDAVNNDYRLTSCSPAINEGDTTGLYINGYNDMTEDLGGMGRFNGSAVDLGAYEYHMDLNVSVSGYTSTAATVTGYTYQWYDCNNMQPISGATSATYTAPLPGNYACIITDNVCATDTTACMPVALGINSLRKTDIEIYPNPINDVVNIDFAIHTNAAITLTSIDGKILGTVQASGTKASISTATLPSGIIILHITDDTGARVTRKLIKQ